MDSSLKSVLSKSWKWILLIILIALVIYKVKFSPVPVSTSVALNGEVVEEVMGTGTLEAHYQTTVSSKIQGLIVELLADQNDWVESGQLLARLDDSDLAREVSTQEAIVNADEATVERVKATRQDPRRYLIRRKEIMIVMPDCWFLKASLRKLWIRRFRASR